MITIKDARCRLILSTHHMNWLTLNVYVEPDDVVPGNVTISMTHPNGVKMMSIHLTESQVEDLVGQIDFRVGVSLIGKGVKR